METATEKTIRDLKAAIKREKSPLRKSNLKFQLEGLISKLAARHERDQVRHFAGNEY